MRHLIICFVLVNALFAQAQHSETPYGAKNSDPHWVQLMYTEHSDPEAVRSAYEAYYESNPFVKNRDTQYFKRMMRELRMAGNPSVAQRSNRSGQWQEAGPWHYDPEVAMTFQVQSPGACHVYVVEQSPSNPDHIWAGTATAGLWHSLDKGQNWTLMTKDLPVTEVYAIAIDPTADELIYFGEGNGKIWRSMNGGLNWFPAGDQAFQDNNQWTRDLRVKPNENNVVFAATDEGLQRSEDFGDNWTLILGGNFMEVEFHPTQPDTVYAVRQQSNTTQFLRSINGGSSFSIIGNGWPFATSGQDQQRTEISVSPAAPNRIYALAAGEANGGSGLFGIYISEDAGETWTFQCCGTGPAGPANAETNPNILGWQGDGSEDGGQYYYDLALDVSPTDPDRMFAAGISVWRSLNAGQSWELNGHWVTWAGENTMDRYTHADVHYVKFFPTENGVDMWIASDGGVYYSSDQGDHIEPRMYGLHGTDFWGFQAGIKAGDVMAGGTYHNGTLIKNKDVYAFGGESEEYGGWLAELAGDNFRGFINPADPTIGYHDGGSFKFSEDRFTRISSLPFDQSKLPNTSYVAGEYGNLEWDPRCMNHIYSPVDTKLWKTTDGGSVWNEVHDFGGSKIVQVKVSRADPDVICVTHRQSASQWRIWRTEDGGQSWTNITPAQANSGNNMNKPKHIDLHHTNPNIMWAISLGDYQNPNGKIWMTDDGGSNWMDLTANLNQENLLSIAHQAGTSASLYVGTRNGVFYRDNTMTEWEPFNDGLPAITPAFFLQNDYCQGIVRCAGARGVHESPFYGPSGVIAGFMADRLELNTAASCEAVPIRFFDNSIISCEGASYAWQFPGGNPAVSNEMNPFVFYENEGLYSVTLTVTDINGNTSTLTRPEMIYVFNESFPLPLSEDFNGGAFPPAGWKIYDPEGNGNWEYGQQPGSPDNRMAQFPNYWVNTAGQTDLLMLPAVDFTNVEDPEMTFDVSYHTFNEYVDGLAVVYRTGNDPQWYTLYERQGSQLHVNGNYIWFWYDEGGTVVWRNEFLDLSALAGESCVELAFKNIGGNGNHIWVDNVNIDISNTVSKVDESSGLLLFPNPAQNQIHLRVAPEFIGANGQMHDALGRVIQSFSLTSPENLINTAELSQGVYTLTITGPHKTKTIRFIKEH